MRHSGRMAGAACLLQGITHMPDRGTFLVLHTKAKHGQLLAPVTEELQLAPDLANYTVVRKCPFEFQPTHGSAGGWWVGWSRGWSAGGTCLSVVSCPAVAVCNQMPSG